MARTVSIGTQDFEKMIQRNCFYVDKTGFIKEWWESEDEVTLITRPRRFGKTLNMSMLNCFFSNKYADRGELFEKLEIWKDGKYREIQGTYPVIFMSFAEIKQNNYNDAVEKIKRIICEVCQQFDFLKNWDGLTETEKKNISNISYDMSDVMAQDLIKNMSNYLSRYYGKKVIILLDEYDTPMQEAYVNGYWEELVAFTRSLFNSTFKTNPYLERAIMTGITTAEYSAVRKFAKQTSNGSAKAETMSKESIFSDLNNLKVITVTSGEYSKCFGFTEKEVFDALDEQGLSDEKEKVKLWYDGFTFGKSKDIYNPWSIINFLDEKNYKTYWADSSSNGLINSLVKTGSSYIKMMMETLLKGETIDVPIDEQIVFSQLDYSEDAVWSLMLASGYLKVVKIRYEGDFRKRYYTLKLTNKEVEQMFEIMIEEWFDNGPNMADDFIEAMLVGDLYAMNSYMNDIALDTFSSFDVAGKEESRIRPENFYHGFVLGLMVDKRDDYIIKSNKESGFGRYDVMMIPRDTENSSLPGLILEFKVINHSIEKSLEETVKSALQQIEEKKYDTELLKVGVKKENIRHYGFAFEGKKVLIGTDE